jgi:agmatine/peptidylarginine deiminase
MHKRLKAEWEQQAYIQLIYPFIQSDWSCCYDEVCQYYDQLIEIITKKEKVMLISSKPLEQFKNNSFVQIIPYVNNDTWARDSSCITIEDNLNIKLLNFTFDAWGKKFDASLDNAMNEYINPESKKIDFVLEGGSIDSNGDGIVLCSKKSVLNKNRQKTSIEEVKKLFKQEMGVDKILFLNNGSLSGDDTDSHIDTLCRFINKNTIIYMKCYDEKDEHFKTLNAMEEELKNFKDLDNNPFNLISLPLPLAQYDKTKRLPATYANFLFINGAILVPIYKDKNDEIVLNIFKKALPLLEVIGIDSRVLIKQFGSLHCITMQFYE